MALPGNPFLAMGKPSSRVATAAAVPGIPITMEEIEPPYSAAWYAASNSRMDTKGSRT
jgi:hypothetical protein